MANKEAVFLLIDVGKTMHEKVKSIAGSDLSRLEVATQCIKEYVQQKLFNSTQAHIGVILFGIDNDDEGNENTLYIQEVEKPDYNLVRNILGLSEYEVPERIGGDIFDAIDKTIATIDQFVGKKKFSKTIFVFTNGSGATEYSDKRLRDLVKSARTVDIKINITSIDFAQNYEPGLDIDEIEFQEDKEQSNEQNLNQEMLIQAKKLIPQNLEIYPANIAIDLYKQFKTKQATNRVYFRGDFEIGKDITLNIELYKKSNELKLPSLKKYSTQADFNVDVNAGTITKDTIDFLQDDPQMEPVDVEDVIKGYYYGRQMVPLTKIFEEEMAFVSKKGLKLLGFTDRSNILRHQIISDVSVLLPVQGGQNRPALASLIKSCFQLNKVAIVRFVYREKSAPKLCVLFPHIAANYECFQMGELPTSESIRDFQFNSLKESTKEQQDAVAELIDKMDLMDVKEDEEDEEGDEALKMKCIHNPTRQYFFQTVMHRAFQQNQNIEDGAEAGNETGLPEVNETINQYLRPEQAIYDNAKDELQKIQDVFKLEEKEIREEKDKKVYWRELIGGENQNKPNEEIEIEGDMEIQKANKDNMEAEEEEEDQEEIEAQIQGLKKGKFAFDDEEVVKKVSDQNPVEDFRKMVENKQEDLVEKAVKEMCEVIKTLVKSSFQGSLFKKALGCLKELRKTCIKEEEVEVFNDFLRDLKKEFGEQDSENFKFWEQVVKDGVTLILNSENNKSKITIEQALEFNRENRKVVQEVQKQNNDNDEYDDLEDEID